MSPIDQVLAKVESDRVRFVNLQFIDIHGTPKSVMVPVHQLEGALKAGKWFDGSSIQGFTRIYESDMFLVPDASTYAVIPWTEGPDVVARFICDVFKPNGDPFEGDPRQVLKRAVKTAESRGFVYNTGPELEFFLLRRKDDGTVEPLPHDRASYFDLNPDEASGIRNEMVLALEKFGLKVESSSHEVAGGQHEIDFEYSDALTTADRAVTLKVALKAIARKHGLHATFMPKPIQGINGSGMHVHQSLFSRETRKNLFFDANREYNLSETALQFIAGQLAHVREFASVIAPTVNSYKRLVPGYEAPSYICWGQINRSALIRIPRHSKGRDNAVRCEIRCPDPSTNPYLAFAVMLWAGMDGISRKMAPPKAVEENVFHFDDAKLREMKIATLPQTLGEAIAETERSELVREALGPHVFAEFVEAGKAQWDEFRQAVTGWELDQYLDR